MTTVATLRLRFLTFKHHAHKNFMTFLNRPDAVQYVRGGVCIGGCTAAFLIYCLLSWLWFVVAYHNNMTEYLQDYYKPETPRFIDTSDFRTPEDKVLDLQSYKDELFKLNQYNTYQSDKTPVNREHKDPRSESCRSASRKYAPESQLETSSIIIVMYNEELSSIVRTIVSVMNTSPMSSVKEILIVDDFSDRFELGARLDAELSVFPFVRLIRNAKREGLIRSKIIGAKAATGKILIFLDSHVETLEGWYKPIVSRLMEDPKLAICPVIAAIDHTSLELVIEKYTALWGAWDWDMTFKWRPLPAREIQRRDFDDSKPIRTPAMAGGIFGIEKEFFFKMGGYDPGMQIWGAENLELSFRIWMCGGAIEINTCSYVGHIFRAGAVFTATGEDALSRNSKRLAEVWLDDYKEAFYNAAPAIKDGIDAGDVVSRVLLRQRLNCKPFSWYLREVFPEQEIPSRDFIAYGTAKGTGGYCIDTTGRAAPGQQIGVWGCHGKGGNQFWKFRREGMIMTENLCLDANVEEPNKVTLETCHGLGGNQQWFLAEDGWIRHGGSGLCLTHNGRHLVIMKCNNAAERFKWEFSGMNTKQLNIFYETYASQFGYTSRTAREAKEAEKKKKHEAKQKEKEKKKREKEQREKEEKEAEKKEIEEAERKLEERERQAELERQKAKEAKKKESADEEWMRLQKEKKDKKERRVPKTETVKEKAPALEEEEEEDEDLKEFLAWKAQMKAKKTKKAAKPAEAIAAVVKRAAPEKTVKDEEPADVIDLVNEAKNDLTNEDAKESDAGEDNEKDDVKDAEAKGDAKDDKDKDTQVNDSDNDRDNNNDKDSDEDDDKK